jgi:hypothetical protein
MRATKIKMKAGCGTSNNLLEIDCIYLTGTTKNGFYTKASVYDYLIKNPGGIQVDILPYPILIPMISPAPNYEKYVKSTPNSITGDNLLSLPRE